MPARRLRTQASLGILALSGAILTTPLAWGAKPVAYRVQPPMEVVVAVEEIDPTGGPGWAPPVSRPAVGICPHCRHRGYICVPAASSFGYFPTLWRVWPGEPRPDKDFPRSVGAEPLPTPVGVPPKPMPTVDINKVTPPAEEVTPPQPEVPPSAAAPVLPSPAVPESPAASEPRLPSGNDGILPPGNATPEPRPNDQSKPAAEAETQGKQSGPLMPNAMPLFPVESSAVQHPQGGLAAFRVAPSQPEVAPRGDEAVALEEEAVPGGEAVWKSATPPLRMISSATGADQPAPDRLSRGIWDIRERPLTVPVGYAEKAAPESVPVLPVTLQPQPLPPKVREKQPRPAEVSPQVTSDSSASPTTTAPQLEGLCPVELLERGQSVRGASPWAVQHGGQTYFCAGAEQQRKYQAHPERYQPALGGRDPVLRRDRGKAVAGRSDFWALYEGRLYWFAGENSLAQFRHNPAFYAEAR